MPAPLLFRAAALLIATQAAIWIGMAAFLLIAPALLASVFLREPLNSSGVVIARLFGAELAGLALASWVTRPTVHSVRPHPVFASYCACNTLGFFVSAGAAAREVMTVFGWILVFLYFLYAAGFAVLWFRVEELESKIQS